MANSALLQTLCLLFFAGLCVGVDIQHKTSEGRKNFEVYSDGAIRDGDQVPTSSTTLIARADDFNQNTASDGDESDSHSITFSEDNREDNTAREPAGDTAMQHSNQWNEEDFTKMAIHRVAHDIPSLLKQVDQAIPKFTQRVLTDYYDLPIKSHPASSEEEDTAFLQIQESRQHDDEEQRRFRSMSFEERARELERKKYDLSQLKDTIQLELDATTQIQQRLKTTDMESAISPPMTDMEDALQENEELTSNNPELKDWADEARYHQNRAEVNQLLDQSSKFLDDFKTRLSNDYNL